MTLTLRYSIVNIQIFTGFSLRNLFKGTYVSIDLYFMGHMGVISGVNCLNFTENIAHFKGHQCL